MNRYKELKMYKKETYLLHSNKIHENYPSFYNFREFCLNMLKREGRVFETKIFLGRKFISNSKISVD